MNDKSEEIRIKEIRNSLTDYEINIIHGLLVDEELRIEGVPPELTAWLGHNFDKIKNYMEEVKRLRKLFTKIDNTEDYCGVFSRIEDYGLDKE